MSPKEIMKNWGHLFTPDRNMIIGTDLDALLSAAFLHHRLGWNVIGYYDLERIHLADGVSWEEARSAVWVDLDIARADIQSIGHHILTWEGMDEALIEGLIQSLNPNLIHAIGHTRFTSKYPLSTVLFLCYLLNEPLPLNDTTLCLLWAADSSYKNMEKYSRNVRDWIQNRMPYQFLLDTKEGWLQADYKKRMSDFATEFSTRSPLPFGSVVNGRGFNLANGNTQVQQILDYVCSLLEWETLQVPAIESVMRGMRIQEALTSFRFQPNLFSYALPFQGVINHTYFSSNDSK